MLVPRFLWDVTTPNRSQEVVAVGGVGTHKACQEDMGDDLLTSAAQHAERGPRRAATLPYSGWGPGCRPSQRAGMDGHPPSVAHSLCCSCWARRGPPRGGLCGVWHGGELLPVAETWLEFRSWNWAGRPQAKASGRGTRGGHLARNQDPPAPGLAGRTAPACSRWLDQEDGARVSGSGVGDACAFSSS